MKLLLALLLAGCGATHTNCPAPKTPSIPSLPVEHWRCTSRGLPNGGYFTLDAHGQIEGDVTLTHGDGTQMTTFTLQCVMSPL